MRKAFLRSPRQGLPFFPQKRKQKTPRLDLLLRPVVPQRAYRRISHAGLRGVRRVPAGLPAVGRRAAVRDYPRSRDGLGGVRQLPAAGPSHPDIRPPQVRTRISGFKERSGGHWREGAAQIRAGWMATGSNRSRQALIFGHFLSRKSASPARRKRARKACPARARKKPRQLEAKRSRSAS